MEETASKERIEEEATPAPEQESLQNVLDVVKSRLTEQQKVCGLPEAGQQGFLSYLLSCAFPFPVACMKGWEEACSYMMPLNAIWLCSWLRRRAKWRRGWSSSEGTSATSRMRKSSKASSHKGIITPSLPDLIASSIPHTELWRGNVLPEPAEGELKCTGIMLVYSQVTVAALEGSSEQLAEVIRRLQAGNGGIMEAKVVSCTEDTLGREFPDWLVAFNADVDREWPEGTEEEQAVVNAASDLNLRLIDIGNELAQMHEEERGAALSSIQAYDPPRVEVLQELLVSEGAPTLDEFLAIFDGVPDVDVESELTWPLLPPDVY